MPYRRLPNTDLSRIAVLKRAIEKNGVKHNDQLVLSFRTIQEATNTLAVFQKAQQEYQLCYDTQIKNNKTFKTETQTARMYISHFIQVMNLAIQRGELRKDIKVGYGLDPSNNNLPSLALEQDIVEWGEKIIKGEESRTMNGGIPIYSPTIAKVKVHYNIFVEHLFNMRILREKTARALEKITKMRPAVDDLIADMWNQIEQTYSDVTPSQKEEKCRAFGVVYVFRKSEIAKMKAEKLQSSLDLQ